MKILGLKPAHWKLWLELLEEESVTMRWRDWLKILWWGLQIPFVADRQLWRDRLRTCRKCPIFDRSLRRCRPFTGSPLGCGCFTPLSALAPQKRCWAREFAPETGLGWTE